MERGGVHGIFDDPAHPYTRALLACVPGQGCERTAIGGEFLPAHRPADGLAVPHPVSRGRPARRLRRRGGRVARAAGPARGPSATTGSTWLASGRRRSQPAPEPSPTTDSGPHSANASKFPTNSRTRRRYLPTPSQPSSRATRVPRTSASPRRSRRSGSASVGTRATRGRPRGRLPPRFGGRRSAGGDRRLIDGIRMYSKGEASAVRTTEPWRPAERSEVVRKTKSPEPRGCVAERPGARRALSGERSESAPVGACADGVRPGCVGHDGTASRLLI